MQATLEQRLGKPSCDNLKWITATQGDMVRLLAIDDVLFFRASEKYVRVVTRDEEALVRMSLKEPLNKSTRSAFQS